MSLKNRFFSFLTVALSVVAFATFSMAQDGSTAPENTEKAAKGHHGRGMGKHKFGGRGHGRHHRMHRGMWMLKAANLTDVQKEQIKVIRESNKLNAGAKEEVQTLRKAKKDGTITADQTERLKALRLERQENRKLVHQQILAILTPEQRAQIDQKKAEMKQRFQERRQKRQQNPAANDAPEVD
jgi:Spy/CpxP family protein refolding chaperone